MNKFPHLLGIDFCMPIIHGVLLYFYAMEITQQQLKNKWKYLLHFIPAISLILFAIPFYSLSGAEKIVAMENGGQDYLWYVIYQNVVTFLSGVIYSILTLLLIRKHQKNIQEKFSNTDEKELQWLKYLSIGLGIIWFIVIFSNDTTIIFSGVVVFVLFIGFFGINQMNIFQTNSVAPINLEVPKNEKVEKTMPLSSATKRYAKSGLTKEMAEKIYSNLNQLMD